MSTLKKISTAAVFALVIIDIIGAITKQSSVICTTKPNSNYAVCGGMATIWSVLEPAIAVIVAALPVYRAILPSSRKRRSPPKQHQENIGDKRDAIDKLKPISTLDLGITTFLEELEPAHVV